MPCEASSTSSAVGQRVVSMRRRRSSICSSVISTVKGRIPVAVAVVLMINLPCCVLSADRSESGAHLLTEEPRLLPGGEVAASVDFVEVDEVGVGLLDPAPGRLIRLVGEDTHRHGDGDAFRVPEAALVFPIEP